MTDTRFLRDIHRLHAFVHTSLESYHSSMCKYVPKSLHFPNWTYTMRTYLAVMDHNFYCNRELVAEYTVVAKSIETGDKNAHFRCKCVLRKLTKYFVIPKALIGCTILVNKI